MRLLAALIFSLTVATIATAQTSQPAGGLIHRATPASASSPSAQQSPGPSIKGAGGTFRTVLSLAAVLGLIVLMYWASRRLLPRGALGTGGTRAIQVLARSPISTRQRVLLLQVGRRILVVAEGNGQPLSTLCEITDPDEAAALIGQVRGEQAAGSRSFSSLLSGAAERFRSAESISPQAAEEPPPPADDLAATQQQLDGLTQRVRVMARQFERA